MMPMLSPDLARRFAGIALGHVTREYPHKADHVMEGDEDVYRPRAVHPMFYGSYDWHSCVHGYWLLARLRRACPDLPEAGAIDALFAATFTADKVAAEHAYLARPSARGFERPYGWAWLLMLAAELRHADDGHAATLQPLADAFVGAFHDYLGRLTYPVRAGGHANSAFALVLAHRYAVSVGDDDLLRLLQDRARAWFGTDRIGSVLEPGGEDFLSPVLMTAMAMRRMLPPSDFFRWFGTYLPDLSADGGAAVLFTPAEVSDRTDGRIAHLDGLNLSRAWAMHDIASALPADDTRRELLRDAAKRHIDMALPHLTGNYMGEHWLATFAVLAIVSIDLSA